MGAISRSRKLELSKMKAFVCFAAVLPVAVGGQSTHQSVSTAHGEQRTLVQSKAFGATHSSVAQADNSKGLSEIQPSIAANRPVPVGHAAVVPVAAHVAHPVAHHAVAHAAPVVAHAAHPIAHHAVHHAAPVLAHPVAHAAPVAVHAVGDLAEVSPYTYNYGVADDYSKAAFSQTESNDGTGVVEGSYSVNLPDGRVQTVTYHANDVDGYVAEVSYAQYPDAVPVAHAVHAAPVVAHAVHAAPVVAHPVAVAHAAPVVAHAL